MFINGSPRKNGNTAKSKICVKRRKAFVKS